LAYTRELKTPGDHIRKRLELALLQKEIAQSLGSIKTRYTAGPPLAADVINVAKEIHGVLIDL
jgi:hypothetical protein